MDREILRNWLKGIEFSHLLTCEPSPDLPFKIEEIMQRFRQIEFKLNKAYLKSSFPKWKPFDKFWMCGWKEGDGAIKQWHYHLLLYSPKKTYRRECKWVEMDVQNFWLSLASTNPFTGKSRELMPLHIEKINNSIAATKYCSKEMKMGRKSKDTFFLITP